MKYENATHLIGRIGVIIGIAFMFGIPVIICSVNHIWPSLMDVIQAGSGLLLLFLPYTITEVFSYTPMLGSSAYITFLTGNVINLKLPCAISAMSKAGVSEGSDEGDVVATVAVATSAVITTILITLGVLLLVPLQPLLSTPAIQTATRYMLPSIFGALFLGMLNESCGDYVAKGKLKSIILPIVLVTVIHLFIYPLAGKEGFAILVAMPVILGCAYFLYKKGFIKMIPVEKKSS